MHLAGYIHDTEEGGSADTDTFIYAAGDCMMYQNRFEDTRAGRRQAAEARQAQGDDYAAGDEEFFPGDLDDLLL